MESSLIRLDKDIIDKLKNLNLGSMNDTVNILINKYNSTPIAVPSVSQDIDKIIEQKVNGLKKLLDNTLGDRIDQIQVCIEKNIVAGRLLK
jgi:hypothetical protein